MRYTGASLGFQMAAAIGGGLSPILATYLADAGRVPLLLIGLALVTLAATWFARETKDGDL